VPVEAGPRVFASAEGRQSTLAVGGGISQPHPLAENHVEALEQSAPRWLCAAGRARCKVRRQRLFLQRCPQPASTGNAQRYLFVREVPGADVGCQVIRDDWRTTDG